MKAKLVNKVLWTTDGDPSETEWMEMYCPHFAQIDCASRPNHCAGWCPHLELVEKAGEYYVRLHCIADAHEYKLESIT